MKTFTMLLAIGSLMSVFVGQTIADEPPKGVKRVPVTFSGGHETDPEDRGRPVVLVAAGLGVKPEVFREAFKGVRPAAGGTKPTRGREQQNKKALLKALGKHGVTNDRLDEVSDYYRYQPGGDTLWPVKPAVVYALVKAGKVVGYEVEDGGSGYSSEPEMSIPNNANVKGEFKLSFGKDLEKNGSIVEIKVPKADTKK